MLIRQYCLKIYLVEYHFNGNFNNVKSLQAALAELPSHYKSMLVKEQAYIEQIFEEVFDHKSFTGRSGTFFGYEGTRLYLLAHGFKATSSCL